jgi:phage shock protein PspC (stress-responsive transcriptional regulator)
MTDESARPHPADPGPDPDPAQDAEGQGSEGRGREQGRTPGQGPAPATRLVRPREGRIAAGVCAGLGSYTGIDPIVFRVAFALLVFAHGQGVMLYIAAALLTPEEPEDMSVGEQMLKRRFDGTTVLLVLGVLLALGVPLNSGGGLSGGALTTLTVCALVLLVAHARKVDFAEVIRTLPDRLRGHPPDPATASGTSAPPVSLRKTVRPPEGTDGMIDLATLGASGHGDRPPEPEDVPRPDGHGCACRPAPLLPTVTLLLAIAAAAAMVPVTAGQPVGRIVQITAATGLAVVALGLVVASVSGRAQGLVACGTVLSLGLMTTSVVAEAPVNGRFGDVEWRPVDSTRSEQSYKVAVGDGTLDLTGLPLGPGQRIRVNGEIMMGELRVSVPNTARVEIDLRAGLGDATVDRRVTSGPNARVTEVLEPDGRPEDPPTIELRLRSKVGNLEVSRA